MDRTEYLLKLAKENPAKVRDIWIAQGSMVCNSNTKVYLPETIFKVDASEGAELKDAIVYCSAKYQVDNKSFPTINWDTISKQNAEGELIIEEGIMTPFFRVILLGNEIPDIEDIPVDENLIPFSDIDDSEDYAINISDDVLIFLLNEIGVPFLRIDELEYGKKEIINYCIKPAVDVFYTYFPIVEEEAIGNFSANQEFKIEFPENAFSGIPYYTMGTAVAGGAGASYGMGAFSLFREQLIYGTGTTFGQTGGYGFGKGISYSKPVPGWTGRYGGAAATALDPLAAAQGYTNYFRREKFHKIKENGKMYLTGFSTIGGSLCVKWFKFSKNFDDIPFSLQWDVKNLCKAYIMRSFSSLRGLVKADLPGTVDFSTMASRADTLEKEVIEKFKTSITNQSFAIARGGL